MGADRLKRLSRPLAIGLIAVLLAAAGTLAALGMAGPPGFDAAQEVTSVHFVFPSPPAPQPGLEDAPAGSFVMARWLGKRARYERVSLGDGSLSRASGINLDTGEWWFYQSEEWDEPAGEEDQSTLHVASALLFRNRFI